MGHAGEQHGSQHSGMEQEGERYAGGPGSLLLLSFREDLAHRIHRIVPASTRDARPAGEDNARRTHGGRLPALHFPFLDWGVSVIMPRLSMPMRFRMSRVSTTV